MTGKSLRDVFDPRSNSLNAIRLLLAVSVIVSHSFAIGMYGPEPAAGGAKLGTWAVLGFFAVSGFLITRSRLSGKPAIHYYRDRALRIFPGFLACLMVVAFVLAPLSMAFDAQGSWSLWESLTYFFRNLALYPPDLAQPAIGQTLQHIPYKGNWNGSLWTLFWEFACYIFIGVAATAKKVWVPAIVVTAFVATSVITLAGEIGFLHLPDIIEKVSPLLAAFSAGAILFLFQDRVRINAATVIIAAGLLALMVALGLAHSLAAMPLAFLVMWLGAFPALPKIKAMPDISYGMYIYAWPVQQFLMLLFGQSLGIWAMIAASITLTIPFAYASILLIEKPAQTHGKRLFITPAVLPARGSSLSV